MAHHNGVRRAIFAGLEAWQLRNDRVDGNAHRVTPPS